MITTISIVLISLAVISVITSEVGWSNVTMTRRNDLVFENRNREYGAYRIRAAYNDHVLIALGIMFLVILAFFSGNLIWKNLFSAKPVHPVSTETGTVMIVPPTFIELPKPLETKPPQQDPLPPVKVATQAFTTPVVVNTPVNTILPANNQLTGAISNITTNGPAGPPVINTVPPTGNGGDANVVEPFADIPPAFPNGEDALMAYLSRNIHYPELEKENGIEGVVFLSFVVSTTGDISEVKELRGVKGGPGLSKEAIRVIKQMPRWTPGKLKGKTVAVRFNLPVRFSLR